MKVSIKEVPFDTMGDVVKVLQILADEGCDTADVTMRDGVPYVRGTRPFRLQCVVLECSFTGGVADDTAG